jgi:hypothetical protein
MPSLNDDLSPRSAKVRLVAAIFCAPGIAEATLFILALLTYSRLSEVSYPVQGLYVPHSVLLFGFAFFILLIAAFQWGSRLGLRAALGSVLLFACVEAILSFARLDFEFRPVLVGLTAFVTLGYMIATFGGWELILKGQLLFMKDISRRLNSRFGVDCTIGMFMFPPQELLSGDKGQVHAECGFRFRKGPRFLAALLYLKTPERILALQIAMMACLPVSAALMYRLRKALKGSGGTFERF